MRCVNDCITEETDEVAFRNTCGMTVEPFLALLHLYLQSTHVGFCDGTHIQAKGVCIGSKVASILSSIFLGSVDRAGKGLSKENTQSIHLLMINLVLGSHEGSVEEQCGIEAFNSRGKG